jgi:hypothetical protein
LYAAVNSKLEMQLLNQVQLMPTMGLVIHMKHVDSLMTSRQSNDINVKSMHKHNQVIDRKTSGAIPSLPTASMPVIQMTTPADA